LVSLFFQIQKAYDLKIKQNDSHDILRRFVLARYPALEALKLKLGGDETGKPGATMARPDNAKFQEICCH